MSKTAKIRERTASVKIVFWTSKTLADGSHPFVVRIHKNGTRKHITTGLSLLPQYWNPLKQEIRQSYSAEKRKALIKALQQWQERFIDAAEELSHNDTRHDANSIVNKIADERNNQRKFRLLEFYDELINQFNKTGNVGNRKVYKEVQNSLRRFIGEDRDVPFDAVTVKFCNEWEIKMRSEGLSEVSLSVKFRTLRAALNKAIANGYAKPTSYPFARNTAETHKFQIGKFSTQTTKRAISKADIRKIEVYEPVAYTGPYASLRDTSERLQFAKDIFLFSYHCGGINFIDMAALRWKNIGTDLHGKPRLNYIRQKTGGKFSIPLLKYAQDVLDRYRPEEVYQNAYIFPILNTVLHKTPTQIHNRSNKVMRQVNADLKTIAAEVGITISLTTYVARHSFATSLKHSGISTAVISEAMGHQDEKTTQIYLSEFDTDLIDAAYKSL